MFIFLTQRYLGIEATALFGFLCKLYMQIVNYLPATLLFSLIQPKLVASYVHAGNMHDLARNANLVGKLSLFVLMPLVAYVWLVGDELLYLLSDGKFVLSGDYLTGLMFAMIPLSQRRILETVAVAIDKNHIVLLGGILGGLSLPLAFFLLKTGQGLWGPIIAIITAQVVYNFTLIFYLVRHTTYRPDTIGLVKLILASLSVLIIAELPVVQLHGVLSLFVLMMIVTGFFLLSAYLIKPFKVEERERLNSFVSKKIFIW
jgi:O-antigen/teichoic acid export membrane protein